MGFTLFFMTKAVPNASKQFFPATLTFDESGNIVAESDPQAFIKIRRGEDNLWSFSSLSPQTRLDEPDTIKTIAGSMPSLNRLAWEVFDYLEKPELDALTAKLKAAFGIEDKKPKSRFGWLTDWMPARP